MSSTSLTEMPPEHVAIIGMGPSGNQYLALTRQAGGRSNFCDQTWGINAIGDVFACDLVFHMDDVRIQQIRADARPQSNIAAMLRWMRKTATPIITSRSHPDYPTLMEFPLEEVINDLGFAYFNNTAAYAVAYAIHIGVQRLTLFGMDYTYPNAHDAERGRACVEFLLGIAASRGIKLRVPQTSSLMDACHTLESRLYGYDTHKLELVQGAERLQVQFREREHLPTADEIEARYDHSVHPAVQNSRGT